MLSAVIKRRIPTMRMISASLAGYRCSAVAGYGFPGICIDETTTTPGILVRKLTAVEGKRLEHFEGPQYQSQLLDIELRNGGQEKACVFVTGSGLKLIDEPWSIDEWRRRHKRMFKQRRQAY
jgi:hypothetical protein